MGLNFVEYAGLYDGIYRDKNYEAECDFIERIFQKYAAQPVKSILDLGCGTGGHVLPLMKRGYAVTGVDRSEEMLLCAREKLGNDCKDISFVQGDIRTIELGTTYDAVISMFAVLSYQTTNDDLSKTLSTVAKHLRPKSLFIFDAWHGPAVLQERPEVRVKEFTEGDKRTIRITHPKINVCEHTVDVHFKLIHIKDSMIISEFEEVHTMRFLFLKEIEYYLQQAGLALLKFCPFMQLDDAATERDWNIAVIAQKL